MSYCGGMAGGGGISSELTQEKIGRSSRDSENGSLRKAKGFAECVGQAVEVAEPDEMFHRAIRAGGPGFERRAGMNSGNCNLMIDGESAVQMQDGFDRFAFSFRRAALHPLNDPVDFRLSQALVIPELAHPALGSPGRHFAGEDLIANGFGPRADLAISCELNVARGVTRNAVRGKNARNFSVVGELGSDGVVRPQTEWCYEYK